MIGYKAFKKGLITNQGEQLEVGKKYSVDGEVIFNKNGYHFCTKIEDTFDKIRDRYADIDIALVESGEVVKKHFNEFYDYYDNCVSNSIKVNKVYTREELIDIITKEGNIAIIKMLGDYPLTYEEASRLRGINDLIDKYIDYYYPLNKSYCLKK